MAPPSGELSVKQARVAVGRMLAIARRRWCSAVPRATRRRPPSWSPSTSGWSSSWRPTCSGIAKRRSISRRRSSSGSSGPSIGFAGSRAFAPGFTGSPSIRRATVTGSGGAATGPIRCRSISTWRRTASLLGVGPTPERVLAQKELAGRLHDALERLPFDQRTAIVLREVDGLSYEEIAFSLGLAVGTVKSRLTRARQALRAGTARSEDACETPDLHGDAAPAARVSDGELPVADQIAVERTSTGAMRAPRCSRISAPRRGAADIAPDRIPCRTKKLTALAARSSAAGRRSRTRRSFARAQRMFDDMHLVYAGVGADGRHGRLRRPHAGHAAVRVVRPARCHPRLRRPVRFAGRDARCPRHARLERRRDGDRRARPTPGGRPGSRRRTRPRNRTPCSPSTPS